MSIRAQRSPRKKDELTVICRYERAAKSKSERGLVSEAKSFVLFPNLGLRCTRIDISSLTRFFYGRRLEQVYAHSGTF